MTELKWELVPSDTYMIRRAAVPGGWLVMCVARPGDEASIAFVPDPGHTW